MTVSLLCPVCGAEAELILVPSRVENPLEEADEFTKVVFGSVIPEKVAVPSAIVWTCTQPACDQYRKGKTDETSEQV